jgi:hypothetical protein
MFYSAKSGIGGEPKAHLEVAGEEATEVANGNEG